jgi:hypothetical protein
MFLEITSTSHNRVDWIVRTRILWIEVSLVIGVFITASLLASTPSSIRWYVISVLIAVATVMAGLLAATTPVNEHGSLERLPDGGELVLTKFWIPIGPRKSLKIPVDDIAAFKYESSIFQDSKVDKYPMSRLIVLRKEGKPLRLTGWLEPDTVSELGDALSKACRCDYIRGDGEGISTTS